MVPSKRRTVSVLVGIALATLGACVSDDVSEVADSTTTEAPKATTTSLRQESTTSTTTDTPVTEDQLIGSWQLSSGYVLTFDETGSWEIAETETLDQPFDGGTYELADSVLTVVTTFGEGCDIDATGSYELVHGEDGMDVADSLGDPCTNRRVDFSEGFMPFEQ